ncbi:hypothetical protein [Celerinatantimonas sp. MCCC 1A17872]|uniref:hypothetical protein n=1 Tax=Celerinatantimonas sp. MCCC 1A17872 TaxID=3177514 RepID=UPI0038C90E6C
MNTFKLLSVLVIAISGVANADCDDNQIQPEKFVVDLSGTIAMTRGYWQYGAHHLDFKAPLKYDSTKIQFVSWGGYDIKKHGKVKTGYASINPSAHDYCNSAGESCDDLFYKHACLVNKSWVSWYINQMRVAGTSYSPQQVCSQ